MRYSALLAASLAAVAVANDIEFVSQDSIDRTIIFQHNPEYADIANVNLPGLTNVTVPFPDGWQGNFHVITEGAPDVTGMLGEVCMNCWGGINYFDISGIVARVEKTDAVTDLNGIKQLFPKESGTPISGCESYDEFCDASYYNWNDVQTRTTTESTLVCTVGTKGAQTNKKTRRHPRHFHSVHRHSMH
jgi:hypothetical protein